MNKFKVYSSWEYLYENLADVLLPLLVVVLLLTGITYVLMRVVGWKSGTRVHPKLMVFTAAFGMIGVVMGYMSGNSREPMTSTLIPAMLTFITGLLGYLMSKETLIEWRDAIPTSIITLVIGTLVSISVGASHRLEREAHDRIVNVWIKKVEQVDLPVYKRASERLIDSFDTATLGTTIDDIELKFEEIFQNSQDLGSDSAFAP